MSFVIEQAGGLASDGKVPVLDKLPVSIHERSQVILGSKLDVQDCLAVIKEFATTA